MKHHKHDKLARYNVSDQKLILSALTGAVLLGSALFAGVTIAADTDKSNQQRETAAAQQEKFKEGAPLQHERLKTLVKASKFAGNIDIHDSQTKKKKKKKTKKKKKKTTNKKKTKKKSFASPWAAPWAWAVIWGPSPWCCPG